MARVGRPRKPAVGRSKGRIIAAQRERQDAPDSVAKAQRVARGATADNFRDPMHGSVLGRLCLAGHISREQFEAGQRWAGVVHRFARAWSIPCATPRAIDLNAIGGVSHANDDDEALRRIREAYDDGFYALRSAGRDATHAVSECVIRDEVPLLLSLRAGLSALVTHFRV